MAKKKKRAKSKGPQGPTSHGAYDAVSPKNKGRSSLMGTSTNKSPPIKGLTPKTGKANLGVFTRQK